MEKTNSNDTQVRNRQFNWQFFLLNQTARLYAHRIERSLAQATFIGLFSFVLAAVIFPLNSFAENVLTYHNDNGRTGQNLHETVLTPANVNTNTFGMLFNWPLDGIAIAQPLYLADVTITNQGIHNVVFIETSHDSVYAFDADTNSEPLWHVSFINPDAGVTTLYLNDVFGCNNPAEIGITGTPVIDPSTQTLYVEATTKEVIGIVTNFVHRLHALDVGSGLEKFGGPVKIEPVAAGTGVGTDGQGNIPFSGQTEFNRAALLLDHDVVYVSYASHCDRGAYHGWIVGFNAETLQPEGFFITTPNGERGGIWESGGGPATDTNGNIYFMSGNGTFDAPTNGDYGDCIIKLTPNGTNLALTDFFCPADQLYLEQDDWDVGSGGLVVLPDEAGSAEHPHLAVGGTKDFEILVVDRDKLGGYNVFGNDQIVEDLPLSITSCFTTPAYFNKTLYYLNEKSPLNALPFSNAFLSQTPSSVASNNFRFPGATTSISANGTEDGIVWALLYDSPSALYAYNATNVAIELYDSQQYSSRDELAFPTEFAVPTVANGKVYVGSSGWFYVYGLIVPFGQVAVAPASGNKITLTWTDYHNYSVEYTTNLIPPVVWNPVAQTPVVNGTQISVTVPMETDTAFYRLKVSQ